MVVFLKGRRKFVESLLLLLISIAMVTCQPPGQFNMFKDYSRAKIRPVQYSTTRTPVRHPITEYLDETQMKMLKHRKGPDSPNLMFRDKGWTGSKAANTNQGETRRLSYAGDVSNHDFLENESYDGYAFYTLLLFIGVFGIFAAIISEFLFSSAPKKDQKEVENFQNADGSQIV